MTSVSLEADAIEETVGALLVQAGAVRAAKIRGELERRETEMGRKRKSQASDRCNKRTKVTFTSFSISFNTNNNK